MSDLYRLSWENVNVRALHLYSDADPAYYSNTRQIVPNSQIPDEHWHPTSRETDDPWDQHAALKAWADADTGFVRNVVLEKSLTQPTWVVVE